MEEKTTTEEEVIEVDVDEETTEETTDDSEEESKEEVDYKALYEQEKERVKKWKARTKKGKAKAKDLKSDVDIDEIVEAKLREEREKDSFVNEYPDADFDIIKELSQEKEISLTEAHILNEFRNGRPIKKEETSKTTWIHGKFKPTTSKGSDLYKKLNEAVPAFMK